MDSTCTTCGGDFHHYTVWMMAADGTWHHAYDCQPVATSWLLDMTVAV